MKECIRMSANRIEQLIEEIYDFVENCRPQPLSSTKVIVPKDELYDLLDELRLRTPDEIKKYKKIIENRDAILADAEAKAADMIAQAQQQTAHLIDEHEIMQQAYNQANDVVRQATEEANRILESAKRDAQEIQTGALLYTEDMLNDLENVLNNAYNSSKSKYENLLNSLKGNLDIVTNNKREMIGQNPLLASAISEAAVSSVTYDNNAEKFSESYQGETNSYEQQDDQYTDELYTGEEDFLNDME